MKSLQKKNKFKSYRNNLISFSDICSSLYLLPLSYEKRPPDQWLMSHPSSTHHPFFLLYSKPSNLLCLWRIFDNSLTEQCASDRQFHCLLYYRVDKLLWWFISTQKKTRIGEKPDLCRPWGLCLSMLLQEDDAEVTCSSVSYGREQEVNEN